MKVKLKLLIGAIALSGLIHCGKKSDDDEAANPSVPTLAVTCGETKASCIGTEAK